MSEWLPALLPRRIAPHPREGTPAEQVETVLFRALIVLRVILLGYALLLNGLRRDEFDRPLLALTAMLVMVAWTAFTTWAYDAPRRRRLPLYVADLAVAVLLMLSTPLVQSEAMLDRHASTVPTFWVAAAVLAWAAGRRWTEAVCAALVLAVTDISVRTATVGATWGNLFLLLVAAGVVGYTADILRRAAEVVAAAERVAAVQAERVRLARAVHDGVLQVLGLVKRHGLETPDLARLGRLAGEQEVALRALIQYDARTHGSRTDGAARPDASATRDLVAALEQLRGEHPHGRLVTLSGPGGRVELPSYPVEELAAVVRACLDNVRRHVGEEAPVWVLVEELPDAVVVSVRDEGPGIPAGRLEAAEQEGRMGVCGSIRGRMTDLGGSAELVTGPGVGTEWELRLPRRPAP